MNATPSAVYSGHTTNLPMIVLIAVLGAPLVILGLASGSQTAESAVSLAIVVAFLIASMLIMSSMRVTIGGGFVRVRFGVFGWPRYNCAIDRIVKAEPLTMSTWNAIWGICWTPRDGMRLTLRTGPAVRLTLTNGRRVTINVENQEAALATLAPQVSAGN